jgi:UDP-N-acetylglucosamine--N-acetylmuramyl-(pentapeptide) pyrophosphoryl-undecaprenol N-acetylglucosamine transferase
VIAAAERPYRRVEPGGTIDVLVFGGSQGARFFSEAVPPALALLPEDVRRRLRVVQQARAEDIDAVVAAYRTSGISAEVAAFFKDLPERMAKAQLVIGRSGASTVAELTVVGRPSILVPLPHALDNDQLQNAARLAESGAAWCIQQKELSAEGLARDFAALFIDPDRLAEAAAAAQSLGRPDAVERLADLVEGFVRPDHVRWQPAP